MTARGPAGDWLNERTRRVPADVRGRLIPPVRRPRSAAATRAIDDASEGAIETLVPPLCDDADRALDAAGRGAGEHRGAFELLRADALITLACEAALAADEPDRVLAEIVSRVAP